MKQINQNSTVGIISPAYIPIDERFQSGLRYLKEKGLNVITGNNIGKEHGYFAGTDGERIDDLHQMFSDPQVDMILAARGGWGGLRLLDRIDFDLIKQNPKIFIGYSDITTLHLAIYEKTGIPSLSGPMLAVEMGKGILPFTEQHFWDQIFNKESIYTFDYKQTDTIIMSAGKAEGILLGGCLSLVTHLLGTPYSPDYTEAILFLEDVGEKPYKIDRYFAHLKQAGVFDQIKGLILGDFIDCEAEEGEVSFNLDELINDYFSDKSYPIIKQFPYGHGDIKFSMPIGVNASLDTESGELRLANIIKK